MALFVHLKCSCYTFRTPHKSQHVLHLEVWIYWTTTSECHAVNMHFYKLDLLIASKARVILAHVLNEQTWCEHTQNGWSICEWFSWEHWFVYCYLALCIAFQQYRVVELIHNDGTFTFCKCIAVCNLVPRPQLFTFQESESLAQARNLWCPIRFQPSQLFMQ